MLGNTVYGSGIIMCTRVDVKRRPLAKGLCQFLQVLDKDVDLRTVKYSTWKSSGDIRLYYREIDPLPKTSADDGDSPEAANSDDSKDEKQKEKMQDEDKFDSKVATREEEKGGDDREQDKMEATHEEEKEGDDGEQDKMEVELGEEEQLVAVMDGEEETNDLEKMDDDNRTEEI